MCFLISYFLAIALLFSLPGRTHAMGSENLSSSLLLGALPRTDSAMLNRALANLLTRQQSRAGQPPAASVVEQLVSLPEIVLVNNESSSCTSTEISELDLSQEREITAEILQSYALKYPKLKKLRISGLDQSKRLIKGELLKVLVECFPGLEELDVSYNDISTEDLRALGGLKFLKRLKISSIRLMDAGIKVLVKAGVAARLTHLEVNFAGLSNASVKIIVKSFKELVHLSIAENFITPDTISILEAQGYRFLETKNNLSDPKETLEYLKAYNERNKKSKK